MHRLVYYLSFIDLLLSKTPVNEVGRLKKEKKKSAPRTNCKGEPQKKRVNRSGWLETINTSVLGGSGGCVLSPWVGGLSRLIWRSATAHTYTHTHARARELSEVPDPPTTVAADVIPFDRDAARRSRF